MTFGDLVRRTLATLEPHERRAVAGVVLRVADRPDVGDIARGCAPDCRGYFWGSTPEPEEPEPERRGGRQLPDENPLPAVGEIAIFTANLRPLSPRTLRITLRHELEHALGHEHDEDGDIAQSFPLLEEIAA